MRRVGQCELMASVRGEQDLDWLESFGLTIAICERSVWNIFQEELAGCGDDELWSYCV